MNDFLAELRSGWRDLLGATVGLGCGVGCYTPVSSLFFRALEHDFGWSRSAAAVSLIAMPLTALVLPGTGWLIDRFGARLVALLSSLLLSLCFFGLSTIHGSLPAFYAWTLALNTLGVATGPISYTRVVARQFQRARGAALSLALVGIAAAAVVLPVVLVGVMARANWRGGYGLLSGIAFCGGFFAFGCIERRSEPRRSDINPISVERDLRALAGSRAFWLIGLAILCVSAGSIGLVSQFQSLLVEKGVTPTRSAWLLSLLAGSVAASRLLVGRALDGGAPRRVAALTLFAAALGAALLLGKPHDDLIVAGVLLFGLSIGAELDLLSFFCARAFGLRRFGFAYGLLSVFFYFGTFAGGLAYSGLHDRTGDYELALMASGVMFVAAAGLFHLIPEAQSATLAETPGAAGGLTLGPLEQP